MGARSGEFVLINVFGYAQRRPAAYQSTEVSDDVKIDEYARIKHPNLYIQNVVLHRAIPIDCANSWASRLLMFSISA